jgi:F0F1-type ATP synthase alpha subunit
MGMNIGKIFSIKDNIIYCTNTTSNSFIGEVVIFNKKETTSIENSQLCEGCIFEASASNFKILLIQGEQQSLCIGDEIYGTSKTIRIKVGFSILGKTINPFGKILAHHVIGESTSTDKVLETLFETEYVYITSSSPGIIDRKKVSKPLLTGINSIDCLFPIGLGQRQLIIGDNNTGKTSLAVSAIINQREFNKNSKSRYNKYNKFTYFKPCIYVLIGQKRSEVIRIQKVLSNFDSD